VIFLKDGHGGLSDLRKFGKIHPADAHARLVFTFQLVKLK
jgi:hypothetical protein